MHASSRGRAGGVATVIGPVVAALLLIWIAVTRGPEVLAAISACPPWVIACATAAHALTLVLRTKAWGTVLEAATGLRLELRVLHAANAGSFVVGTVQNQAALPARIGLLRQLGGGQAPEIAQIALADAPIFMLEVCTTALLAAVAATAVPSIPDWAPAVLLLGAVVVLCGLRLVHLRFAHRPLVGGLAVLAQPRARGRLVAIVLAFTAAALVRTWIVLIGFGLPAGPTDAALLLFSMGAIGLLPLGSIGSAPAATVAAMGATDLTAAAAAGVVIGASTVLAAVLYATASWAWRPSLGEPAEVIELPVAPAVAEPRTELDLAA
jgi:hypothetical protein